MTIRALRALLIGAAVLATVAPTGAPFAHAHALCASPQPAHGATVDRAPDRVSCTFSEPLAPGSSTMTVLDHCRRRVDDGDVQILLREMSVGMIGSSAGEYEVRWETVSAADGHAAAGAFGFTVAGTPAACLRSRPRATKASTGSTTAPRTHPGTAGATSTAGPEDATADGSVPTGAGPEGPSDAATSAPNPAAGGSHAHHGLPGTGASDSGQLAGTPPRTPPGRPSRRPELLLAAAAVAVGLAPLGLRRRAR